MRESPCAPMHIVLEFFRVDQAGDPYGFRAGTQEYVLRGEGGGAETATLTWGPELLSDLRVVRLPGRDPVIAHRLGDHLRRFLGATGWSRQEAAVAKAVQQGEPVLITLRSSAAELYALPWELLTLQPSGQAIGTLPGVLIRYEWPETHTVAEQPEPRPEGGRILLAWSAAAGAVPAAEQLEALRQACARGHHPFDLAEDVLAGLSYARLHATLERAAQSGEPVSVLHILCHGGQMGQTFGLCWDADEAGDSGVIVDAGRLRELLSPHASRLRLVVLCACDGGNQGELGNQLGSVAQTLHRAGIAAVVASRYPLSVAGSIRFSTALYAALLGPPGSLESAFVTARQELGRDAKSLDWASIQLYARAEDGEDSRPVVFRPYRGLLAFNAKHTRFFFGRETEQRETLADLFALKDAGAPRFLIVAGASGTGKSSVVLSGTIPELLRSGQDPSEKYQDTEALQRTMLQLNRLWRGRTPSAAVQQALDTLGRETLSASSFGQAWQVSILRPGNDPMAALSLALAERRDPACPLLLVVDQFEEIFTHTADKAVRHAFAARLWSLAKTDTGVSCIITLRVDFLGQCGDIALDDTGLRLDQVAYDEKHRIFVAQMGPQQMRAVIEGPARLCGLRIEEGLAGRMLADVGNEPGALPLLEYTLDQLWQRRRGRVMTADAYADLGGVVGALQQKANQLINELGAEEQKQARRILVRLVGIGENGATDTRRQVPVDALAESGGTHHAAFDKILAAFVQARLLVLNEQGGKVMAEVAHEALIRKWEQLRKWVDEDRGMLAELQELFRWVRQWQDYKTLLQGDQLGYATRVLEKYPADVSDAAREMIAASQRAQKEAQEREQELVRQREAQQQRELEAARNLAQVQERAASDAHNATARQKRITRIAVAVGVLAAIAAVISVVQYKRAKKNEQKAEREEKQAQQRLIRLYEEQGALELQRGESLQGLVYLSKAYSETQQPSLALKTLLGQATRPADAQVFSLRHGGQVKSAAWSPDGTRIATAVANGMVQIWDAQNYKQLSSWKCHANRLNSVAWSPDGARVVTTGFGGTARIWDAKSGEKLLTLEGHLEGVNQAVFSSDGTRVLTASMDKTARVWDAKSGKELLRLEGHKGILQGAAWSPDGTRIVGPSYDASAKIWDAKSGKEILSITTRTSLLAAAWSPDGSKLLTGGYASLASIWDAKSGAEILKLTGHQGEVSDVAWSPDGKRVVTASEDKTARIWEADSGKEIMILEGHTQRVHSAVFSLDGAYVLTASDDNTAKVWNTHGSQTLLTFGRGRSPIISAAWSLDESRVVTADQDQKLRIWDTKSGQELLSWKGHDIAIRSVAWSPDGTRVVSSGNDHTARIWDAKSGQQVLAFSAHIGSFVRSAAFSPDGKRVVSTGDDKRARIWDAKSGQELTFNQPQPFVPLGAAWSPDGAHLIVTGNDPFAEIWDARSGQKLITLKEHTEYVIDASFSRDGARIITISGDRTAKIWDAQSGRALLTLQCHQDRLRNAAFSPDGLRAVTGGDDGTAKIWDATSGKELLVLRGHAYGVSSAVFSADSRRLFTTSRDGLIRVWDVGMETRAPREIAALINCRAPFRLDSEGRMQPTEPQTAAKDCQPVMRMDRAFAMRDRARNLDIAARTAVLGGHLKLARTLGVQAAALFREQGVTKQEAEVLLLLGEVARLDGDEPESQAMRAKAHGLFVSLPEKDLEAKALRALAVWNYTKRYDAVSALADYDRARELLPETSTNLFRRCELELAAGRFDAILQHLAAALENQKDLDKRTLLAAYAWSGALLSGSAERTQRARDLLAAYKEWPKDKDQNLSLDTLRYFLAQRQDRPADVERVLQVLSLLVEHEDEESLIKLLKVRRK